MSDILEVAKFDAGVQTERGREQFSVVKTAGSMIGNREYKEGYDKFAADCPCADQYIWRALSAVADETGRVLYDNVKNYIDYVTNIDICKVQSLRSMIKMYGLEYKVFDRLDLLPVEVLDLINIFSINKKYVLYGNKILSSYRDRLSSDGVQAINFESEVGEDANLSDATVISSVLDYHYPVGGNYYEFVYDSFKNVLNDFLNLSYTDGGNPIYKLHDKKWGVYGDLNGNRSKYTSPYGEDDDPNSPYQRRQYKIRNGVPLQFDEVAALDRIESGIDDESAYSGAKADLIQMEREYRALPYSGDPTSRYAFYKRRRVLEYANFVINKYYTDHKYCGLSAYRYDSSYFEVVDAKGSDVEYDDAGQRLIYEEDGEYKLSSQIVESVARSLADTAFYISDLREKIKLQTRKNYMKGTYNLMLYVINEYLVDYARTNPLFREDTPYEQYLSIGTGGEAVSQLLSGVYADLSSHDITTLDAIEYFDSTEYYNISASTNDRSDMKGVNDRFWVNPSGDPLFEHPGEDVDFDVASISSFYMDTLGIRDNYISDETTLCAFLDAVYNLGAVDSYVHTVSADPSGRVYGSAKELFGAQVEKYGEYSDELYQKYLDLKRAWATFMSYLSDENYEYQVSNCVSAQAYDVAEYIRQRILDRELSSVSAVYDAYINDVDQLSSKVDVGVYEYNNLVSGEYSYYFEMASKYKYCFTDHDIGNPEKYKHEYYTNNSEWDGDLDYWYDMLQHIEQYSSKGDHITNWPIRDTVEYFKQQFTAISSKYKNIMANRTDSEIGVTDNHDWETEYGFVDIDSVSLEDELKYGYDFMQTQVDQRRQYILDMINDIKSQATGLQTLAETIKSTFASTLATYDDNREDNKLGDGTIYCVSWNKPDGGGEWDRKKDKPPKEDDDITVIVKEQVGSETYFYYKVPGASKDFDAQVKTVTPYRSSDKLLVRCANVKAYMNTPTSYYAGTSNYNYSMLDEGVNAAMDQIEHDWNSLSSSVDALIAQLEGLGYNDFSKPTGDSVDVDDVIVALISYINENLNEDIIEKDPKILAYKMYLKAIVQLSSIYIPVKYEYDSLYKDSKQMSYLSEFTQDTEMTIAALDRLSAYSEETDAANKQAILEKIADMKQKYQDAVDEYNALATRLAEEYMLPQGFQPYDGYIEEMVLMMYDALRTDVDEKTEHAYKVAQDEFDELLAPAAENIIHKISPYQNSLYKLPDAVSKKLKELYYLDDPSYLRQKELFLTYGGRSFCYYPYYNLKNTVHPSYQTHPFLWNFIRRDIALGLVYKTFFSVNVDELEAENVAANWRNFFGDYGESKYLDLSKPRYPDYSGYQSRYETSYHVADNTQLVSEVVDYDGAFYPPAVDWMNSNSTSVQKAISSVNDLQYSEKMAQAVCEKVNGLDTLAWKGVSAAIWEMETYMTQAQVNAITSEVNNACYAGKQLSDVTLYGLRKAIKEAASKQETFYGRFYRQLRLDLDDQVGTKNYIVEQLKEYWSRGSNGPSIKAITNPTTLDNAYDIYKYGIDSYGNMYCLYKKYNPEWARSVHAQGGLGYRYKQSTPGDLWIRLKNHPLAFPAFSGNHPNVYMADRRKRHVAFTNLFHLYEMNASGIIPKTSTGDAKQLEGAAVGRIQTTYTSCIYDFELTQNRDDITFVTQMRSIGKVDSSANSNYKYTLSTTSREVQTYQNSWLVRARPRLEQITPEGGMTRTALTLYPDSNETDYFRSGANYLKDPVLSSEASLDGEGQTLYQYIGSYLRGAGSIYHAYALKHVYRVPEVGVVRETTDEIKILPVINGYYSSSNDITGRLTEGSGLQITGPDVCILYDETSNVINFAAQTVLAADTAVKTDCSEINLSANADGPTIDDPLHADMDSHDIFSTNVTLFRKKTVSRQLRDVRSAEGSRQYTFNTNADMSYFPVYPGFEGRKELYRKSNYYDYYDVELLGVAKDIQQQISFVNPEPDPYLDAEDILSGFANARVYEDYVGYLDETLKTVDNELIGQNSKVLSRGWYTNIGRQQQVVDRGQYYIWQIGLNSLYENFQLSNVVKMKVLMYSRKCCGKNPYLFADMSTLAVSPDNAALDGGWKDLVYDSEEPSFGEYSIISASDYVFSGANRVIVQSTLDGVGEAGVTDSNHIYNVKSVQARLVLDEQRNYATLEFRFMLEDDSLVYGTFVPEGQLQVVLMDVRNLDVFNYFHYLDAYGVLRVKDVYAVMEQANRDLVNRGPRWTVYYGGHVFTEEELASRLKSFFEYKGRMIPLSAVDLSQYDSLSDVYILQGSRRLQFKVDEEFRYELDHPGYFYPTLNAKFPMTPAQYALARTSFKENAANQDFVNLFGQNNLFLLDMEDPEAVLSSIGRVDIPIMIDESECMFAYEEYFEYASGDFSGRRNCELYDTSDPRVLQFVQFEADVEAESRGIPKSMAEGKQAFEIPDELISNVGMDMALANIMSYTASAAYGVDGVYPVFSESGRVKYIQEYIGFTLGQFSISRDQMAEILRLYVNYRKYDDEGSPKIQLYFNYMNYLNSPYLKIKDNRTYVDVIDNTYLSLKQDEDGVLDVVAQFRYYRGGALYGYKNVKLASYQVYNISDDKPKFMIKKIYQIQRNGASIDALDPLVHVRVCDVGLDTTSSGGESSKIQFDLVVELETNSQLKQIKFYLDYPSDFMEFRGVDSSGYASGSGWSLKIQQPGYALVTFNTPTRVASIPAQTVRTKSQLVSFGDQTSIVYVDRPNIIGKNGKVAQVETSYGKLTVWVEKITQRLNVLLTEQYSVGQGAKVFNTEYSTASVKALLIGD